MNLVIMGSAGAGKGTQAKKIAEKFNIPHISTGDIFRESISKGTELGKIAADLINDGNLVPDEITNKVVEERIGRDDCQNGYLLDGYPRNVVQAEYLDSISKIDAMIDLEVSEAETIKRMSNRRVCSECKADYNLIYIPPKKEGLCNKCDGTLIQRDDDKPDAIRKRLDIYHNETEPLINYYKKKGVLKVINGEQPIDKVFEDIVEALQ